MVTDGSATEMSPIAAPCARRRGVLRALWAAAFLTIAPVGVVGAATDTFANAGTFSWIAPADATSVTVEVWGGGGAGGGQNATSDGGGGGGGGAYSRQTVSVVPGNSYTVVVGAGGVGVTGGTGGTGGDSYFINAATVMAKGGGGGAPSTGTPPPGGAGGAATSGVGSIRFSGGTGGRGRNSNTGRGGPGGSSAGTAADGTDGPDPWSTLTAAAAPTGGGIGGNGGDAGNNGLAPASGNGGGGGGSGDGTNRRGGDGAPGMVAITYVIPSIPCNFGDIFDDDFNRTDGSPGAQWATSSSSGTFGAPKIVSQRLRLTNNTGNNASAATLLKLFPGSGNKVVVEFDHYAYGSTSGEGNGADGIAVTFSDATITPNPGAYGGSLGYAPMNGISGFAGGWLGVGIDEYGNFSNCAEGRSGGLTCAGTLYPDAVAVRGSGSGSSGGGLNPGTNYAFHASSSPASPVTRLSPGVDGNGNAIPAHRYRITLDHSNGTNAWVSVERDTGAGYAALIPTYDAKTMSGQAAVPANWFVSYTGSTGGVNNIHEIDNLRVCATQAVEYNTQIDHFRFYYDSPAPACATQSIRVQACKNPTCSETVSDSITATFTSGQTFTFRSDDTLSFNYAGSNTVGAISSTPALKPLSQAQCFTTAGAARANCSISVAGSGFTITVPNHVAGTTQAGTVRAQTATCQTALANLTRNVNLWSTYANPATNPYNSRVTINGTTIGTASPGTGVSLSFNGSGIANINVVYPDAGAMTLNASCSAATCGTAMTGSSGFVAKPREFRFTNIRRKSDDFANPGGTLPPAGTRFAQAGEPIAFDVTAWNGATTPAITRNFGRETTADTLAFSSVVIDPAGGDNGTVTGKLGAFTDGTAQTPTASPCVAPACVDFTWSEVGNMRFHAALTDGDYLGAGDVAGDSVTVGRFYPAQFAIDHNLVPGCVPGAPANAFTYAGGPGKAGQSFGLNGTVTAQNRGGLPTLNYRGVFAPLTAAQFAFTPLTGSPAAAASGSLNASVVLGTFAGGTAAFTTTARYAFANEGVPQTIYARVTATDSDGVSGTDENSSKAGTFRFGRLLLNNANGSELSSIAVPLSAEYLADGSGGNSYYVVNGDDRCTALGVSNWELSTNGTSWSPGSSAMPVGSGTTSAALSTPPLSSGTATLTFSAPGAGNVGGVYIRTALATAFPWLLSDWNGDGTFSEEATGLVTFGIYRGSRSHIYLRELY